jgi:hypothetical protein
VMAYHLSALLVPLGATMVRCDVLVEIMWKAKYTRTITASQMRRNRQTRNLVNGCPLFER